MTLVLGASAAALAGAVVGISRRQSHQRTEQAAAVEGQRERVRFEQARAELLAERNRLGREIHDVLAHTLGALSVQLEALDTLAFQPERTGELREGLRRTRGLVVEGLREARDAVGALREDSGPLPEQLAELCGPLQAALAVSGTPRELPPESALACYRAVQESLANAAKHARGAAVSVELAFEPGTVAVTVMNGSATVPSEVDGSAGYGLQGMRERVMLLGGQVDAGPMGEGWRVRVRIPE